MSSSGSIEVIDTEPVNDVLPSGLRVTMVIRLDETECARFQKLLIASMADADSEKLCSRIMDCLEVVLPTENVRRKVAGHLFAVYLDKNFDGVRFTYPQRRSDA